MDMIATTISEHVFNQGEIKGRIKGEIEGENRGKILGKIELLEYQFMEKILSAEQFEKAVKPLRKKLKELLDD